MNEAAQPFEPPPPPPSHPSDQVSSSLSNAEPNNKPANGSKASFSDRSSAPGSTPADRSQRGGRGMGRGGSRPGRGTAFDRHQSSPTLPGGLQGRGEAGRRGRGGRSNPGYRQQQQQFPAMVAQGGAAPQMYFPMASTMYYPPTAYGMPTQMPPGMPAISQDQLLLAVQQQIEYYFSMQNLVKDVFLRSKMNDEGWISLHVIASFNRVRMLTPDLAMIMEALAGSASVELSPDNLFIRPKQNHQQWVLPVAQRDATAHNTPHMPSSSSAQESASVQQPATAGSTDPASTAQPADAATDTAQASTSQVASADAKPSSTESISRSTVKGTDGDGSSQQRQAAVQQKDDADEDAAEDDELFEMDEVDHQTRVATRCMQCYQICMRNRTSIATMQSSICQIC